LPLIKVWLDKIWVGKDAPKFNFKKNSVVNGYNLYTKRMILVVSLVSKGKPQKGIPFWGFY